MTAAWDAFEREFLGANSWAQRKDGFPGELLDALGPEEKLRAEEILLERLDGSDDWPIRAMGWLGCVRAVSRLRGLLEHELATIRAFAATAIYDLTGDAALEGIVRGIAADPQLAWMMRLDAVYCLGHFATDSARRALKALEGDPDYLISYNAKRAPRK